MEGPIKVLVVDDEKLARQKILRFLADRKETLILEEAQNGLEAIEKIATFTPDVIFLDIEMPEISGFEVLSNMEKRTSRIIFATAFDEFALRAFKENACDYLLKPFSQERFSMAFDRALREMKDSKVLEKMQKMEHSVLKEQNYLQKMVVKQGNRRIVIEEKDITCFVSENHYTMLYTNTGKFICDLSLDHLSSRLNPAEFVRLHRNNIVRTSLISAVSSQDDTMSVTLKNKMQLPVSRQNRKMVKDLFSSL